MVRVSVRNENQFDYWASTEAKFCVAFSIYSTKLLLGLSPGTSELATSVSLYVEHIVI